MEALFETELLGNPLVRWAIAVGIAAATTIGLGVSKRLAVSRLAALTGRTDTRVDDVVVKVVDRTKGLTLLMIGLGAGARSLDLPDSADRWLGRAVIVVLALQAGLWVTDGVRLVAAGTDRADVQPGQRTMGAAAAFLTNLVVWTLLVLLVLSNFGVEVTTLVAGLGVGGIAAALAVQNVLGDLFAAFSIYLDRPFDIGDFVVVDAFMGSVEKIGWRSTQLRSLGGEMIVLANSDLARARIRNFKRMRERRVVVQFGVAYGTPAAKLERIPVLVRETIERIEGVRFDRSHFAKYGESSLDFETVFYVLAPDYNAFMDRQQHLLLTLYRRFEEEGIAFAFPTRTVQLQRLPGIDVG